MADFARALAFTLVNEGSAYTEAKLDRGGPTRLGVTQHTLSRYLGRPASADEVRALTPQSVAPIYRKLYWEAARCDVIGLQSIATMVFDAAVLCGVRVSASMLAYAYIPYCDGPADITTDISASMRGGIERRFCLEWQAHLISIAERDPTQLRWLDGWVTRVHRAWRLGINHRELMRTLRRA